MTEGSIGVQNSPTGLILTISVGPAFLSFAACAVAIDPFMIFYAELTHFALPVRLK